MNNYKLTMNHSIQQSQLYECSEELSDENKDQFLQQKYYQILEKHSQLKQDQAFYLEYCKLYIDTIKKQYQIQEIIQQIEKLKLIQDKEHGKIKKNISQDYQNDTSNQEKKKRIRRTANQIARHYVCQVQKCQKSYGSQGSLNQHIKLKHKELSNGNNSILHLQ